MFQGLGTVAGVLLMNKEGYIVRSNMDEGTSGLYCSVAKQILHTVLTRLSRKGDGQEQQPKLNLIRINCCTQELIIFPMQEEALNLIIVQRFAEEDGPAETENL